MPSIVSILLFLMYTVICSWLIFSSSKIRLTGLGRWYWIAFFLIKILAGVYYGYWCASKPGSDTWHFHQAGLIEAELLRTDPLRYFSYLLDDYVRKPGGLLKTSGFWNDFKDNLMVKLLSLMDLMSGGRYYVNVVIYEWITFWGLVFSALTFRTINGFIMPLWALVICALLPSCLFWTSGIHRDGLVLLEIAYIIYQFSKPSPRRWTWWAGMGLFWVVLFFTRNYVALLLLPGLLVYRPTGGTRRMGWVIAGIYTIMVLGICLTPAAREVFLAKKTAFEALEGNSRMSYLEIGNNAISFIKIIPNSLGRAVFFPEWDTRAPIMQLLAASEGWILLFCWLFVLIVSIWKKWKPSPLTCLLICFSISCLWVIGTIVPFSGAIVRYRAIFQYQLIFASCLQFSKKFL